MKTKMISLGLGLLAAASPMMAQDAGGSSNNTRLAAAYLSVGIASGLCGLGQGKSCSLCR